MLVKYWTYDINYKVFTINMTDLIQSVIRFSIGSTTNYYGKVVMSPRAKVENLFIPIHVTFEMLIHKCTVK